MKLGNVLHGTFVFLSDELHKEMGENEIVMLLQHIPVCVFSRYSIILYNESAPEKGIGKMLYGNCMLTKSRHEFHFTDARGCFFIYSVFLHEIDNVKQIQKRFDNPSS